MRPKKSTLPPKKSSLRPKVCRGALLLTVTACFWACDRPGTHAPTPTPAQSSNPVTSEVSPEPVPTSARDPEGVTPHEPPSLQAIPKGAPEHQNWAIGADAKGKWGGVTSVDASATRAGVGILEAGGNAIDAAVATALALAVTHPSAGNLGGGGFLLLKKGRTVEAIDFREDSPKNLTTARFLSMIAAHGLGPDSVGVPGTVAGLYLAHQRHGALPWAKVVAPATRLARQGYPLGARQADVIRWAESDLKRDPVASEELFPQGKAPSAGQLIKRPRLALALERIERHGADGFYEGPTAEDLIQSLGDRPLLSLEDLKNYRAKLREPLFFDFGPYRIITMPPPSAGGVALAQNLLMAQALDYRSQKDPLLRMHLLAEVSRRAQVERQLFVVAPELQHPDKDAAERARALDPKTWLAPFPVSMEKKTESSSLHSAFGLLDRESDQTTHLSVVDKDRNLVSLTVTLSGSFGARLLTRETGIVLNNAVASFSVIGENTPAPQKRTTSSMAPTLVLTETEDALVLGSPGGDTIPSTLTQVFLGLTVQNLSLRDAVRAPRFHQGFSPDLISTERRRPLGPHLVAGLRKKGHRVEATRSTIGDANIIALTGDLAYAISDEREGGRAAAANEPSMPPPALETSGKSPQKTQ